MYSLYSPNRKRIVLWIPEGGIVRFSFTVNPAFHLSVEHLSLRKEASWRKGGKEVNAGARGTTGKGEWQETQGHSFCFLFPASLMRFLVLSPRPPHSHPNARRNSLYEQSVKLWNCRRVCSKHRNINVVNYCSEAIVT